MKKYLGVINVNRKQTKSLVNSQAKVLKELQEHLTDDKGTSSDLKTRVIHNPVI